MALLENLKNLEYDSGSAFQECSLRSSHWLRSILGWLALCRVKLLWGRLMNYDSVWLISVCSWLALDWISCRSWCSGLHNGDCLLRSYCFLSSCSSARGTHTAQNATDNSSYNCYNDDYNDSNSPAWQAFLLAVVINV